MVTSRRSAPSASHKALAHGVAAAQGELLRAQHGSASAGPANDAIAPELLTFCRKVRQALAKERWDSRHNGLTLLMYVP